MNDDRTRYRQDSSARKLVRSKFSDQDGRRKGGWRRDNIRRSKTTGSCSLPSQTQSPPSFLPLSLCRKDGDRPEPPTPICLPPSPLWSTMWMEPLLARYHRLSLSSPHIPLPFLRVRENACSTKGDEKGGRKGKREGRLGWVVTANGVDAMTIIIIIGGGREGLRRKEERESVC